MADGFSGMAELIADLRRMPKELEADAAKEITRAVADMAADVKRVYDDHRFKGNLSKGVVTKRDGPLKVRLRQIAPLIHLFEFGSYKSGERFWKRLPDRSTGTLPGIPTWIPAAVRHRARMYERFEALKRNLKVRGMTGTP